MPKNANNKITKTAAIANMPFFDDFFGGVAGDVGSAVFVFSGDFGDFGDDGDGNGRLSICVS